MTARQTEAYRLGALSKLATEISLKWRRIDENKLEVDVAPGAVLVFYNLVEQNDTLVGFLDSQWHAHGIIEFSTKPGMYIRCDELDILIGIGSGDLVIVTRYLHGRLVDRWLAHKDEPFELQYILSGEELRMYRIADTDPKRADGAEGSSPTKTA